MIIAFNGKLGSGKDTAAALLADRWQKRRGPLAEFCSFADALKNSSSALIDVPREIMEANKNNDEALVTVSIGFLSHPEFEGMEYPNIIRQFTLREFWQRYGTEAHRDIPAFGPDVWVNAALPLDLDHSGRLILVTDCRFPSEATRVSDLGGIVVQVIGPNSATGGHESENALEGWPFRHHIRNHIRDDGFANLNRELDVLMQRFMI